MKYENEDITLADVLREALAIERGGLPLARRRCLSFSRIVCLGDMIAANPNWWRCNRLHFFCPELTHAQIAALLGLQPYQVRDALKKVRIPDDAYADLPDPDELWKKCNM